MKPASAKAKGRKLQQWIAEVLSVIFGWEEGDAVSRPMGSSGVDILLSPKARGDFPFSIESKARKTQPTPKDFDQSDSNNYKGCLAAVVWKPNRAKFEDTLICFRLKDFAEFWRNNAK